MRNGDLKFMTIEQAKSYYNLSRPTVVKMAEKNGALKRIGRALRIDFQKLDEIIEEKKVL